MNGLRIFLESQGLSEKDIQEAIAESRKATRMVQYASGKAVEVFTKLAGRAKHPTVVKGLVLATMAMGKLEAGASEMLGARAEKKR